MNSLMRKSFRRIGWGFVFPLLDIHIGLIDVLPDFIGYIIIFAALNQLESSVGIFKSARILSAILILLSLPQLLFKSRINVNELSSVPIAIHVYTQGIVVLHALLFYFIIRGLYTIAKPTVSQELQSAIVFRIKLYMTLIVAQLMFYPFQFNFGEDLIIPLLLMGGVLMIAELLIVRIPFRISHIRHASVIEKSE